MPLAVLAPNAVPNAAQFKPGDKVMVVAKGDFYAFVDGWCGTVRGLNMGLLEVVCPAATTGPDAEKVLFVPADELVATF